MIIRSILIFIFVILFIYSIFRPSRNIFSKLFLISGSILGFLIVIGEVYLIKIANMLGVGRGTDLILYLALLLVFFFIFYTLNRFSKIRNDITELSRKVALKNIEKEK